MTYAEIKQKILEGGKKLLKNFSKKSERRIHMLLFPEMGNLCKSLRKTSNSFCQNSYCCSKLSISG